MLKEIALPLAVGLAIGGFIVNHIQNDRIAELDERMRNVENYVWLMCNAQHEEYDAFWEDCLIEIGEGLGND